ncbi:Uncharacterized protein DAT39_004205 [Clarias magur]|uniref:Uncharacterized protein n=1 Tax=Clarias magur TaxID=1594786 RepID=A0A8J4X6F4_CLAMG|nr:Uncharacterized protein DAT39_004205 [Clarias magur]
MRGVDGGGRRDRDILVQVSNAEASWMERSLEFFSNIYSGDKTPWIDRHRHRNHSSIV